MISLCMRGGTVRLAGRVVVDGVDLDIRPGELLGLLGPNGAGKTTVVKALAGVLPCAAVSLEGRPLRQWPVGERARRIAYVPQGNTVHWPLTAREVAALGRLPHRDRWGRGDAVADRLAVDRAMARADVSHLAERTVDTLSGGERARVLLARALAVGAPVLLADEPAASLDPGHQLHIMTLLRAHCEAGGAGVAVMHDLTLAARYCHRLALLNNGRLLAVGTAEAVLSDAFLAAAYGVAAYRGMYDGQPFLLPWARVSETLVEPKGKP